MIRGLFSLAMTCAVGYGGYVLYQNNPDIADSAIHFFQKKISIKEFQTLELRYTPSQIISAHRRDLIKDKRYKLSEPVLKFYPHVLVEVKYSVSPEKTAEGIMLWSLVNGEMVLNMRDWSTTHGYEDCLNARTSKAEFVILNLLAKNGGFMDKTQLLSRLRAQPAATESTLLSCQRKKLIVQTGKGIRLHFENPRFCTSPSTSVDQWLVTKPYKGMQCVDKKYSASQIKSLVNSAFGYDFAIRRSAEVYLPVYEIEVKNPDGTISTSHWNAVTGTHMQNASYPMQNEGLSLESLLSHKESSINLSAPPLSN